MAHWGKSFLARVAIWSMAHGGTAVALLAVDGWFPQFNNAGAYALPVGIAVVQAALLFKALRAWTIVWVPASLLGVFLSFLGIWWYLMFIGLGMGTTQTLVLAAARLRRSWLWPMTGGTGWFLGMLAGTAVTDAFLRNTAYPQFVLPVLYTTTAVVYGAFLGAAASVLGKR